MAVDLKRKFCSFLTFKDHQTPEEFRPKSAEIQVPVRDLPGWDAASGRDFIDCRIHPEESRLPIASSPRGRLKLGLALVLMSLPATTFYLILWNNAFPIPFGDDYDVILALVNRVHQIPDLSSKVLYALTVQHNGYKLLFANAVILGQYGTFGQVYFLPLIALGNAFALLIFLVVVVSMLRTGAADLANKALLMVPTAFLFFQLQYASTLDFASTSLAQLPVMFFSLLSIALMARKSRWSFAGACMVLVLAIASCPNGFFVAPVGLLMLLQYKRWRRMPAWIGTTGLMLAVYLFRYVHGPSRTHESAGSLTHFNLVYALSFLGSSAARYASITPALVLGTCLCAIVAVAAWRGYFSKNPAVFYSMLFILINAVAISGLRSDQGLAQSLASRYRIYSNLLLALSYIYIVEDLLPLIQWPSVRRTVLTSAAAVSVAFCALSDMAGARFLEAKKQAVTLLYDSEWNHQSPASTDAARATNPAMIRQLDAGIFDVDVPILQESVRLGVYQAPPQP